MNRQEIFDLLIKRGYNVTYKIGGLEIVAKERIPTYEFDYNEFVNLFEGSVDKKKIHFLDPWTFTIECE